MNNICKQYIKNVKSFFPISGEELYRNFGTPSEVVNTYYSHMDINYILKQIKRTKAIKALIISLITSALVIVSAYCISLYSEYEAFRNQEIFFEETFIE